MLLLKGLWSAVKISIAGQRELLQIKCLRTLRAWCMSPSHQWSFRIEHYSFISLLYFFLSCILHLYLLHLLRTNCGDSCSSISAFKIRRTKRWFRGRRAHSPHQISGHWVVLTMSAHCSRCVCPVLQVLNIFLLEIKSFTLRIACFSCFVFLKHSHIFIRNGRGYLLEEILRLHLFLGHRDLWQILNIQIMLQRVGFL